MTATLEVKVVRKTCEAPNIHSFELADARGAPLPVFSAGAHIDVHLGGGLCRQYSLCNPPQEAHRYEIAVLREQQSRGGSAAMHERVAVGDTVTIGAPRNLFPLHEGAAHSVLFAGGIGITPMLAMAAHLAFTGASFALHYHGRSRERMAFLARIRDSAWAAQCQVHVDDEPDTQIDVAAMLSRRPSGTHCYVCGPAGYIDAISAQAAKAGVAPEFLHVEHFSPVGSAQPGDGSFELTLARSGLTFMVAGNETVVDALARHGIEIETSCEQGICGTCLTTVLEGEPDHRDRYLSKADQACGKVFLPCCSRALSKRLVIDL